MRQEVWVVLLPQGAVEGAGLCCSKGEVQVPQAESARAALIWLFAFHSGVVPRVRWFPSLYVHKRTQAWPKSSHSTAGRSGVYPA